MSLCGYASVPAIYSFTSRETSTCTDRSTSGLICQSCELIARCVRINNNWLTIPVETCNTDAGFYCNLNVQGCSNDTGPCHPFGFEGNFACTSEGVFPDPYDCQKYHMCYKAGSTLVSANIECGGNKAFSAATGDCSLTINNTVCTQRQYNCTNAGDSAAWPNNRNIFYMCKATLDQGERVLYPTMYRCASGEIFNGNDCVDGSVSDPSGLGKPFKCVKRGFFEDPYDCKSYYYCDLSLKANHYTCSANTRYNRRTKSCVKGTC